MSWIEEELTLAELSSRFLGNSNFKDEGVFDISDYNIEVLTLDNNGDEVYKPILNYLVKSSVSSHYTDGNIKVTPNHRIVENGEAIFAKDHPEFTKVDEPMDVVDIEVDDLHTYLANGRLNHNTTSGGKALQFHSSVRLRLKNMGRIKQKVNGQDKIIGMKVRCQVIKNRMGPPLRSADFEMYFDRGIDDYGSWLKVAKDNKILKGGAGGWYTYEPIDQETGEVGEKIKIRSTEFAEMMEEQPELREELYKRICEETILQYKSNTRDYDSMEVDEEGDDL